MTFFEMISFFSLIVSLISGLIVFMAKMDINRLKNKQEDIREKVQIIEERAEHACSRNHELSNKVQQLMNK